MASKGIATTYPHGKNREPDTPVGVDHKIIHSSQIFPCIFLTWLPLISLRHKPCPSRSSSVRYQSKRHQRQYEDKHKDQADDYWHFSMFIPPLLHICQRQIVLTPLLVEFSTQFSAQFESRWVLQTTHTGVADLEQTKPML